MYRYFVAVFLFFSIQQSFSQVLSSKAEISVLTIGPTQKELYSAFGHSGFRVHDPANQLNKFYNYGIFDFNQPNFYLNFTKGKLLYKLGVDDYELYKKYYIYENRSIVEQFLNLNQEQKQAVFDFLEENSKPENAEYYYNYIYDNCATKIRDVLNEALGNKIQYDYSYASEGLTYRQLMDLYLGMQPWGDLGIDICLGSQIDQQANGHGYMYLPDFIQTAFDKAKISDGSGSKPLVKSTETVFKAKPAEVKESSIKPFVLFVIIFFFIGLMTHRSIKYGVRYKWLDVALFGITGTLGLLLLLLWFATDHLSAYNFNLIWAMPLNLIALIFLFNENRSTTWKYYYLGYGLVMLLFIVFRELLPQQLHLALVPLVLGLAIRSFYLYFDMRRKERGDRYIL